MNFWCIRNPWNTCLALDEFGSGTLDGVTGDGPSYDACGPAAVENVVAAYQMRVPTYSHIGAYRKHMMAAGEWTKQPDGAAWPLSDPRTNGCFISNVRWLVGQLGMQVLAFTDYQDAVLSEQEVYTLLSHQKAVSFIVTDAQALAGNEHGVLGHFVSIVGYGGDRADGSHGNIYLLNSDIAGQHGLATGQWMSIPAFLAALPHGAVCYQPAPEAQPMITLEKDSQGNITGGHDEHGGRIGAGFAFEAEQKGKLGDTIAVSEVGVPNATGLVFCVLANSASDDIVMTYSQKFGVGFFEAPDLAYAVHHLWSAYEDAKNAPAPPAPPPVDNSKAIADLKAVNEQFAAAIGEVQ